MAKQQERQIVLFSKGHPTVLSTSSFWQIAHSSGIAFPLLGLSAFPLWIIFYYTNKKAEMQEKYDGYILKRVSSYQEHSLASIPLLPR